MTDEVVKNVQFKISLDEWKAWKHESFDQGMSMTNMIRNIVNASLVKKREPSTTTDQIASTKPPVIKTPAEAQAAVAQATPQRGFAGPITKQDQARGNTGRDKVR